MPEPLTELRVILAGFHRPWWVAGEWALDLAVGWATREHDNVEIAVLFDHQNELRVALPTWDLWIMHDGRLSRWRRDELIELPRHQLWSRRAADAPCGLEARAVADEHLEDRLVYLEQPLQ